jgi:hypothetical protein
MPNGTPFFCTASGTFLKNGWRDWERLPASERKPGSYKVPERQPDLARAQKSKRLTKPPADGVILRTYIRGLKVDRDQQLFAPRQIDWSYGSKLPAEPNRDFMWLRKQEWEALLPTSPQRGMNYAASPVLVDRICHWHIAGGYHCLPPRHRPEDFTAKSMAIAVESVNESEVSLRLTGAAAVKSGKTYRFHGVIGYRRDTLKPTRFDVIALADEGKELQSSPENVSPFRHYGVAFELAGERTDDLLPPFYGREQMGDPNKYFANDSR